MWKNCLISDLGNVVGGATPPTSNSNNYDGDIPWITPKDLSNHNERYIVRGERNITDQGYKNCSAQMLPKGSVLFSSRAPIGYVAIAANEVCTNQGFKSIAPNDNTDSLFLYYLLIYNRSRIESMGSGTTFKEVSGTVMKQISIKIPTDIREQRAIAAILSCLDDKIELNNRINANLEAQAQAIFKSWFVDFEPWGGVMPDDWREGTLGDIAFITMGQSPDGSSYNENGIGTVFYQGRAEFGSHYPTRRLFTTQPKRMAKKGDVLMSVRAPVGDSNIAFETCCIGRGLAAIKSNNNAQSFIIYALLALKQMLDMFNGEGTVFGSINKNDLTNLTVVIPTNGIVRKFEDTISPMDAMIRNNYTETCILSSLRDFLLPKLMSGDVRIYDMGGIR